LFAVTLKGVFVSDVNSTGPVSDANDMIWTADSSGLKNINCLLPVNNLLFAGTDSNGVYLSNDRGLNWTSVGEEMPADTRVWSLAANGDNIFAGTSEGIWQINLSDINHVTITADALKD
jgi:ligand-binding sensor domain-containing protein